MTDVNAVRETDPAVASGPADGHDPVPAVIDWALAGLAGLIGVAMVALGVSGYRQVDRAEIADAVASESVELEGITRAELVDAAVPFLNWLTVGVAVSGGALLVAAVVFVRARRQTRRRVATEGGTTATFWACAVYGSAVGVLTSFIPGSLILGGGVAAFLLERDAGIRVGAAAGVVGSVLFLPLVVFLAAGLLAGGAAIGELAGSVFLVSLLVVAQLVAIGVNAGLGALGGFLADWLA
jgi:hypothetical protein